MLVALGLDPREGIGAFLTARSIGRLALRPSRIRPVVAIVFPEQTPAFTNQIGRFVATWDPVLPRTVRGAFFLE